MAPSRTVRAQTGRTHLLRLLDALDHAGREGLSPAEAAHEGLPPARAIDALLRHNRLTWHDLLPRHPTLAKICGRFGSDFPGEREAAWRHAVRELIRRHDSWPTAIVLPATLAPPPPRDDDAPMPVPATPPVFYEPRKRREAPAPEGDWLTTIRGLLQRGGWRTEAERDLLHDLERMALAGDPLADAHRALVRDIWWLAELADPGWAGSRALVVLGGVVY
jgi:hypothetical protein